MTYIQLFFLFFTILQAHSGKLGMANWQIPTNYWLSEEMILKILPMRLNYKITISRSLICRYQFEPNQQLFK